MGRARRKPALMNSPYEVMRKIESTRGKN